MPAPANRTQASCGGLLAIKITTLEQSLLPRDDATIYDAVAEAFSDTGALLRRYHHLLVNPDNSSEAQLARLHQQIDTPMRGTSITESMRC
ncbi:MAG: hypothetical protein HC809_03490 [Gammaproteobacteria bacterium]|nr:hypothetical protein [Gammaproteobacteria bacterium]